VDQTWAKLGLSVEIQGIRTVVLCQQSFLSDLRQMFEPDQSHMLKKALIIVLQAVGDREEDHAKSAATEGDGGGRRQNRVGSPGMS
jgi:hypothetical protein